MPLSIREIRQWPEEIPALAKAARDAAANHTKSADFYRELIRVSSWHGQAGRAANDDMTATYGKHDARAEDLTSAAASLDRSEGEAQKIADTFGDILHEADTYPAVHVDEDTNTVTPSDDSNMDTDTKRKLITKVVNLRQRIAAALASAEPVDADIAKAIGTATGTPAHTPATTSPASTDTGPGTENASFYKDKGWYPTKTPASTEAATAAVDPNAPTQGPVVSAVDKPGDKPAADPKSVGGLASIPGVEDTRSNTLKPNQPPTRQMSPADELFDKLGKFSDGVGKFVDGVDKEEQATENHLKDLLGGNGEDKLKQAWTDTYHDAKKEFVEHITHPGSATKEAIQFFKDGFNDPETAGKSTFDLATIAGGSAVGGEAAAATHGLQDAATADATHLGTDASHLPPAAIDHTPPAITDHTPPITDHPAPHLGDHALPPLPDHYTPIPHDAPPPPPLPHDHPLFDGYQKTPPGPEFTNPDGSLHYPDINNPAKPYAVPGTVIENVQLQNGTVLGRFGYPGGEWLAPEGTPFAKLSLPDGSALKPYYNYVVADMTKLPPGWSIEQSQVAPWFHQPGLGTQYRIVAPPGVDASTAELVDSGFLDRIARK